MRHYGFHVLSGLARILAGVSIGLLGMLPSARGSFLYPPIPSEPILSATLTINIGGLYGNRFLFGEEENSAVLLAPGFSPLDLSSALFGTSSFPNPPLVNLANDETEIIGAALPSWFFPALRGGDIGYSFWRWNSRSRLHRPPDCDAVSRDRQLPGTRHLFRRGLAALPGLDIGRRRREHLPTERYRLR